MPKDEHLLDEQEADSYFGSYAYLFRREVLDKKKQTVWGEALYLDPPGMKYIRLILLACFTLFIAVIFFPRFPHTLRAQGAIVPLEATTQIMAPRTGVIRNLFTTEGQDVSTGTKLADIFSRTAQDPTENISELQYLKAMLEMKTRGKEETRALFVQSLEEIESQVLQNQQEIANIEGQISLIETTISARKESLSQLESLVEKGSVSKVDFFERQNRLIDDQRQRLAMQSSIDKLSMTNQRLRQQAKKAESQFALETGQNEAVILELQLRIDEAQKKAVESIFAPRSGRLLSLNVVEGRWVVQNQPIAVIGSPDTSFEVELYLTSKSVGEVKPGQTVVIKLQAFPYRTYGTLEAEIIRISETSFNPGDIDTYLPQQSPFFIATARLKSPGLFALKPGMQLNADIVLEESTILDSIFSNRADTQS